MDNSFQDILFSAVTGMDKDSFERKAGLRRNPELGRCPICKEEIIYEDNGDMACKNFNKGCYWHRYSDGLNFWSSTEEIIRAKCKEDPEFAMMINKEGS